MDYMRNTETFTNNKIVVSARKANRTFYSDRLWQWDYDKYCRLATKWFGSARQILYGIEPRVFEGFLKEYMAEDLTLVSIEVIENASSGYPIWRFDCYIKESKQR